MFIPSTSNIQYESPTCPRRRRPPQHAALLLRARETHAPLRPDAHLTAARAFYTAVVPSATVPSIRLPETCFLRKFSPDGRRLVAFSAASAAPGLEIFSYRGAEAAGNALAGAHAAAWWGSPLAAFVEPRPSARQGDREAGLLQEATEIDGAGSTSTVVSARYPEITGGTTGSNKTQDTICDSRITGITEGNTHLSSTSCHGLTRPPAPNFQAGRADLSIPSSSIKRPMAATSDSISRTEPEEKRVRFAAEDMSRDCADAVRNNIFTTVFRHKHSVPLSGGIQSVNRECSLFTPDSEFILVASSGPTLEAYYMADPNLVHRSNESLGLGSVDDPIRPSGSTLEDYCIYSVCLSSGIVVDKQWFRADRINLSHNQGFYLYDRTLAVLSLQHQTIHVFHVDTSGCFVPQRQIGRFLSEADERLWDVTQLPTYALFPTMSTTPSHQSNVRLPAYAETSTLCSLKHRVMAALYKQAQGQSEETDHFPLRDFYRHWDTLCSLRLWKMQLLNADTLLLRYASQEVVQRRQEPECANSLFVVYNMITTKVEAVFENVSEEFLRLTEQFADEFRNVAPGRTTRFPCSVASSYHALRSHLRLKAAIRHARNGGSTEATRRLLNGFPIPAQSFSGSPYLDPQLFSYDEKWISLMERPKAYSGDYPIKFFGRNSGLLKFQLECNLSDTQGLGAISGRRGGSSRSGSSVFSHNPLLSAGLGTASNPITGPVSGFTGPGIIYPSKHLVAFIFHPTDPFIISVQRHPSREYVVNFHLASPHTWLCD